MGKITKNLLSLIIGSVIVWGIVVFIFKKEVFFPKEDNSNGGGNEVIIPEDAEYKDGSFEGKARGHNGEIVVLVTIEGGIITKVDIISHKESEDISDPAIEGIPAAIVQKNSIKVDDVTGATVTSKGIVKAVIDALKQSIIEK